MGAKLLYGEISSLTHAAGYCWAENSYFSNLYDVDNRTIQRWLESLKKQKFIKVETTQKGIKTERKIWISPEVQKMFTERQKCHPPHDKNVIHNSKYEYEKESIKEKAKERTRSTRSTATKITFDVSKRSFDGISLEDLRAWKEKFPSVSIDKEIARCVEWAISHYRKNYRNTLLTWFKHEESNHTKPGVQKEKERDSVPLETRNLNKSKAEGWEKAFAPKANNHYGIYAGSEKVDFVLPEGKGYSVDYNFTEKEFIEKCQVALKKMQLKY